MQKCCTVLLTLLGLLTSFFLCSEVHAGKDIYIFQNGIPFKILSPDSEIENSACLVENELLEQGYPAGVHTAYDSRRCPDCKGYICSNCGPYLSHCLSKKCQEKGNELSPWGPFKEGELFQDAFKNSKAKCSQCNEEVKGEDVKSHAEKHTADMEVDQDSTIAEGSTPQPTTSSTTTATPNSSYAQPGTYQPAYSGFTQYNSSTQPGTGSAQSSSSPLADEVRTLKNYKQCPTCKNAWDTPKDEVTSAMKEHIDACPERLKYCEKCNKLIRREDRELHDKKNCPRITTRRGIAKASSVSELRVLIQTALESLFDQQDRQEEIITALKKEVTGLDSKLANSHAQLEETRKRFEVLKGLEHVSPAIMGQLSLFLQSTAFPLFLEQMSRMQAEAALQAQVQAQAQAQASSVIPDIPPTQAPLSSSINHPGHGVASNNSDTGLSTTEKYNKDVKERLNNAAEPVPDPTAPYTIKVTDRIHLTSLTSIIKPKDNSEITLEDTLNLQTQDRIYIRQIGPEIYDTSKINLDISILIKIPEDIEKFEFQTSPAFIVSGGEPKRSNRMAVSVVPLEGGTFVVQLHVENKDSMWVDASQLIPKMGFLTTSGLITENIIQTENFETLDGLEEAMAQPRPDGIAWENKPVYASISSSLSTLNAMNAAAQNLHVVSDGASKYLVLVLGMSIESGAVNGLDYPQNSGLFEPSQIPVHTPPVISETDLPPNKRESVGSTE